MAYWRMQLHRKGQAEGAAATSEPERPAEAGEGVPAPAPAPTGKGATHSRHSKDVTV